MMSTLIFEIVFPLSTEYLVLLNKAFNFIYSYYAGVIFSKCM